MNTGKKHVAPHLSEVTTTGTYESLYSQAADHVSEAVLT